VILGSQKRNYKPNYEFGGQQTLCSLTQIFYAKIKPSGLEVEPKNGS